MSMSPSGFQSPVFTDVNRWYNDASLRGVYIISPEPIQRVDIPGVYIDSPEPIRNINIPQQPVYSPPPGGMGS